MLLLGPSDRKALRARSISRRYSNVLDGTYVVLAVRPRVLLVVVETPCRDNSVARLQVL